MRIHTMERLNAVANFLPFILATGNKPVFLTKRIIEGLLIAVITAGGSGYVTLQIIQQNDRNQTVQINDLKNQIKYLDDKIIGIYKLLANDNHK